MMQWLAPSIVNTSPTIQTPQESCLHSARYGKGEIMALLVEHGPRERRRVTLILGISRVAKCRALALNN